jgi:hypothetical protein
MGSPILTAPTDDPGHLVSDAAWQEVLADAAAEAARIGAGQRPEEAPRLLRRVAGRLSQRYTTGLLPLAGQVNAPSNGGRRPRGAPTFGVLHSAETPLAPGYAAAIARYFGTGPGTSCHYMVDPAETWGVLDDMLVAWHCGNGNTNSLAVEQAGYARLSRAEWTTPDGLRQMDRVAAIMGAARGRWGIGLYLMTDDQLRDAAAGRIVGGWATHDQCRRVLGGTTHTDPMPNYPMDLLMAKAAGTVPAPAPAPVPVPVTPPRPRVAPWKLKTGHWLGNVNGGARQHGGKPYDGADVVAMVETAQRFLVYRGVVPGQDPAKAASTGWADGSWTAPTDGPMAEWHRRYYPGQQFPSQCWLDDYRRLTA